MMLVYFIIVIYSLAFLFISRLPPPPLLFSFFFFLFGYKQSIFPLPLLFFLPILYCSSRHVTWCFSPFPLSPLLPLKGRINTSWPFLLFLVRGIRGKIGIFSFFIGVVG